MSLLLTRLSSMGIPPSGFGPNRSEKCIAWFDADRPAVTYSTVTVPEVGDIDTWFNKSGFADASSTAGTKPERVLNNYVCGLVARDEVNFDVGEFMTAPFTFPFNLDGVTEAMAFVVFRTGINQTDAPLFSVPHIADGAPNTDGFNLFLGNNTVKGEVTTDFACGTEVVPFTVPMITGFAYADTLTHLIVLDFDASRTGSEVELRIDSIAALSFSLPDASQLYAGTDTLNIARYAATSSYNFEGKIHEILIYNKSDLALRNGLESYLTDKWCT